MADPTFERESRYVVLKRTDLHAHAPVAGLTALDTITAAVEAGRAGEGKPPLHCVVVESDWPEYELVWGLIQARVTGEHGLEPPTDFNRGYDAGWRACRVAAPLIRSVEDDYLHFRCYSNLDDDPLLRYAYFHGAGRGIEKPNVTSALEALSESEKDVALGQAVQFAEYVERQAKGSMVEAAGRFLSLPYAQAIAARLASVAVPPDRELVPITPQEIAELKLREPYFGVWVGMAAEENGGGRIHYSVRALVDACLGGPHG